MKNKISKTAFAAAEKRIDNILAIATQKGGFEFLTAKQKADLAGNTKIVKEYEDVHYPVPMPQTLQGLLQLKMYEKKLKQKDIAKLLSTTDTKFSEIMHHKRKPSVAFLKAIHKKLGIDGNLLLKVA